MSEFECQITKRLSMQDLKSFLMTTIYVHKSYHLKKSISSDLILTAYKYEIVILQLMQSQDDFQPQRGMTGA